MNKEEVLQAITRHMESNIKDLNQSLADYEDASNLDESDTIDPEDFSQQSEGKEMQYQVKSQLDRAHSGLSQLKEFSGKNYTVAKSGALVETDKNWFLLGISFPSLKVDGKELLGISPESPAYNVLNGKSKGESFILGKNNYTILNIY